MCYFDDSQINNLFEQWMNSTWYTTHDSDMRRFHIFVHAVAESENIPADDTLKATILEAAGDSLTEDEANQHADKFVDLARNIFNYLYDISN